MFDIESIQAMFDGNAADVRYYANNLGGKGQ